MSPSLLRGVDIDKPVPMDPQIGWEELLGLAVNPIDYELPQLDMTNEELLMAASQRYESGSDTPSCNSIDAFSGKLRLNATIWMPYCH